MTLDLIKVNYSPNNARPNKGFEPLDAATFSYIFMTLQQSFINKIKVQLYYIKYIL